MRKESIACNVNLNLIHLNIFDLNNIFQSKFDIVLEYTCYCAIDPSMRSEYVKIVNTILKPGGKFVAILFPLDKAINKDGPPYGVNLKITLGSFYQYFSLDTKEYPIYSIKSRKGREIFIILNKYGN
jgi:SAM-dependent methyltransferase